MKMLNRKQVISLIKAVGDKRTVIVLGENGVGKTSIQNELSRDPMFANHTVVDPIECTQLSDGSVWMPDIDREAGVSRELPNDRFGVSKTNQKGINGSKPVLICFDEILKPRQYIKDMIAPPIYERRIGGYHFVERSVVWGASNLAAEGLGDLLQPHLRSRLVIVGLAKPTSSEFIQFGTDIGMAAEILAFCEETPNLFDSFLDYEPGGKHAGQVQEKHNGKIFNPQVPQDGFASPRTLHAASDIVLEMDNMDTQTLQAALEGTVGRATADDLGAYIRFGSENPSFAEVCADPAHARVAKSPIAQIVMTYKLITNSNTREQAEAATEYVARMRNEMQSLFCNSVANSSNRVHTFMTVKPYQNMLAENKIYFSTK